MFLLKKRSKTRVLFVGRDGGKENEKIKELGYPLETIEIRGLSRKNILSNVKVFCLALRSTKSAKNIIKSFSPDIVVATDDQRIYDAVIAFGGNVMLTSSEHNSGTDRCCEIVEKIGSQYDAAVNIQGDEPFINPEQINHIASLISTEKSQIASLCKPIKDEDELFD